MRSVRISFSTLVDFEAFVCPGKQKARVTGSFGSNWLIGPFTTLVVSKGLCRRTKNGDRRPFRSDRLFASFMSLGALKNVWAGEQKTGAIDRLGSQLAVSLVYDFLTRQGVLRHKQNGQECRRLKMFGQPYGVT